MAQLIYSAITSLDGYIADATGKFDWAEPDEEVHAFINDLARPIGTYLLGRRMYEVMTYWETVDVDEPPVIQDFAKLWQTTDKVVYSTTLESVSTARTRIEREFDPDAIRQLKGSAQKDISVGGPQVAAHAIRAGLVDDFHIFVAPIFVGGGTRFFPHDHVSELGLLDERRFAKGFVYLRYRKKSH